MDKEIEFDAAYGQETKQVRLLGMNGHNGWYHVYIDKYFMGQLFYRNDRWVFFGNIEKELTFEDVEILGQIIDENN